MVGKTLKPEFAFNCLTALRINLDSGLWRVFDQLWFSSG